MAYHASFHRACGTEFYPNATNPSADITALINAMGVTVNAFLDCRVGLVFQSGFATVNTWNDQSGHGNGVQQTTQIKQPSLAPDGAIRFSGAATNYMQSSAVAAFNIGSSYSLIVVGKYTGAGSGTPYIASIGNATTSFLGINNGGAGTQIWTGKGGQTIVTAASAVSTNAPQYRVVSATINGTTPLGFQVSNQSQVTTAIGLANQSVSAALEVGGFNGASGNGPVDVRAVICLPSLISAPNLARIVSWAQQHHSAYPA